MARPALLVVDMVNDFVTGVFGNPRSQAMVPRLGALLTRARAAGVPIVYCSDSHLEGVDVELTIHKAHALRGTWGAEIVADLTPDSADYSLTKRRYSAFFGTQLEALLRELSIDTVILTGVATNGCVRHTAADAFFHGFKVVVVGDCVESADEDSQRLGLSQMERSYGAHVTPSTEVDLPHEPGVVATTP